MTEEEKTQPGPVAVVAVHGVADQQPSASARAVADLLLRVRRDGLELYRGFRELAVRLPLRPVRVAEESETPAPGGGKTSRFDERLTPIEPAADDPPPHHRLNRSMVEGYAGSCGTYETVRLEGERTGGRPVHVYEMYWADLSRVGEGLLALLGAFYQLTLHLPHLGRLAVDGARAEYPGDRWWAWFGRVHNGAVRVFTLLLPVAALLSFLAIFGLVPLALPASWKPWVATVLLVLAVMTPYGLVRYSWVVRQELRRVTWFWAPPVLILATGWVGYEWWIADRNWRGAALFLLLFWAVTGSALFLLVLRAYARHRPGVVGVGSLALVFAYLVPMVIVLLRRVTGRPVLSDLSAGVLKVFEAQLAFSFSVAALLYVSGALASVLGIVVVLRARRGPERWRARRVVWTALATLGLSTALFYLFTLLLGFAGHFAGRPLLAEVSGAGTRVFEPFFGFTGQMFQAVAGRADLTQLQALERLLQFSGTSGLTVLVSVFGVLLFFVVWGLGPAVWREVRPLAAGKDIDHRRASALGRWVDRAYEAIGGVLYLLFITAYWISPIITLAQFVVIRFDPDWPRVTAAIEVMWNVGIEVLSAAGVLLAASAVGLAFHGRLRALTLGFRPLLDIALDIDGYLRQLPADRTPRAQIFERYASLLRYLATWRDDAGRGYEAIVFVAHSQGSVITVDLLDLLMHERNDGLEWIPEREGPRLELFTMGSPLAQLYARNFPHHYGWITGEPAGWYPAPAEEPPTESPPEGESPPADPYEFGDHRWPEPRSLGLSLWVNAYRSGDYVGRSLWRDPERDADLMWLARDPKSATPEAYVTTYDRAGLRREVCLGAGAHTHYWDETADAVAEELDRLLR